MEYAPFQKVSHRDQSPKRPDLRLATLEDDSDYLAFLLGVVNPEPVQVLGTEKMLEEIEAQEKEMKGESCLLCVCWDSYWSYELCFILWNSILYCNILCRAILLYNILYYNIYIYAFRSHRLG